MSIKCGSCGLINWATASVCRRCNTSIALPLNAPRPAPTQWQAQPQQNLTPNPFANQSQQNIAPNPLIHQPQQNNAVNRNIPPLANSSPYAQPQNQQPYWQQQQPYSNQQQQPYSNQQQQPYSNQQQQYPQGYVNNPQGYVNQRQGYVNQRQGYVNNPQGYANNSHLANPQGYANQQTYPHHLPYAGGQSYQRGFAPQTFPSPYAGGTFVPPPASTSSVVGPVIKILLAFLIIGAVVVLFVFRATLNKEHIETMGEKALKVKYLKAPNHDSESIEALRQNILFYIGKDKDSKFGYEQVRRQLFKGISEIEYDTEKGEVFFTLADCANGSSNTLQSTIINCALDPSRAVFGEELKKSKHSASAANLSGSINCSFMLTVDNVRINPYTNLEIKFPTAVYTISVQELGGFLSDRSIFGGHMRIFSKDKVQRELNVFGNHGAFVARPNEPSLTRLAGNLTHRVSLYSENAREQKVQNLLDFVSSEIEYDQIEASFKGEILKRPDETLMAGRGDCSSKSILLASLLEQINEDYLLVYYKDHITVAVRKGKFPNNNGLTFMREGETWLIAEATVPGFQIGETIVENKLIFKDVEYVQRPDKGDSVAAFDDLREIYFE